MHTRLLPTGGLLATIGDGMNLTLQVQVVIPGNDLELAGQLGQQGGTAPVQRPTVESKVLDEHSWHEGMARAVLLNEPATQGLTVIAAKAGLESNLAFAAFKAEAVAVFMIRPAAKSEAVMSLIAVQVIDAPIGNEPPTMTGQFTTESLLSVTSTGPSKFTLPLLVTMYVNVMMSPTAENTVGTAVLLKKRLGPATNFATACTAVFVEVIRLAPRKACADAKLVLFPLVMSALVIAYGGTDAHVIDSPTPSEVVGQSTCTELSITVTGAAKSALPLLVTTYWKPIVLPIIP